MLLCTKIKLEVSEQDSATLEFMQSKCRSLYNWWVMKLRDGEHWNFAEAKRSLQQSKQYDPELEWVYSKLLHEVYYRLDHAMQAFYRRVKAGETPGFPRFRPRHNFFTLCYPAMYLKVENGKVLLPTGGGGRHGKKQFPTSMATLTETPPDGYREVAISRNARGNYYASFSYKVQEQAQQKGGIVAFDLGIKTLATGVNEQGRVYNEWGLYTFIGMLTYKCQLYGKELHFLDERNTSKMCSGCGQLQAMPLWKRTYCCTNCGLVMDRDENSAHNILTRFLAGQPPHTHESEYGVLQESCVDVASTELAQPREVQQLRMF